MTSIDINQALLKDHTGENFIEHPFERIAIVTRGETAQRLIHAVRELNRERRTRLSTVALFTEPDQRAMFVREADDAVRLSQAAFIRRQNGQQQNRYQDRECIEQALVAAQVNAAWAGSASLAEEPWFADLCQRLGIVFIGPDADTLRQLGNKISAKHIADRLNIPVVPWSNGPVETVAEAQHTAEQIGYPLIIKPAFGTKGQGIHRVSSPSELANVFEIARDEARKLFGEPTVFIERLIEGAHLVEAQIIADNFGTTWAVGVREGTIQRRNQKFFEESASSVLSSDQERELREAAIYLCQAVGYKNIGTVEFLYCPDQQAFWFLEVNPRLTIEHPVTEAVTGLDLVKLQLDIAHGSRLEGEPPVPIGHAVGVRLYAEDPANNFAPSPGTLDQYQLASGPGLRVDTGFAEGDIIPSEFDPLLTKIMACGRNRQEALARLSRSLAQSVVVVRGGMSNKAFLRELLNSPELDANKIDTSWVDRIVDRKEESSGRYADIALLQAAVEAYDAELQIEQTQFYASAARGRPRIRQEISVATDFRYLGQPYQLSVARLSAQHYRVTVEGHRMDIRVERFGPFERRVTCCGQRHRVISVIDGSHHYVEVEGIEHRITREEEGIIRAPAPTVVVSVPVALGDYINVGDRLVVVEAMKVEMAIPAPFTGRVTQLFVTSNVQVDAGAPLVQLKPLQDNEPALIDRVRFDITEDAPAPDGPQVRCQQILEGLRNQILGYDIDPAESKRLLNEQNTICQVIAPDDQGLQRAENEILSIFADICLLFRRELDPAEAEIQGEQVHSAEQDLLTYLRSRDTGQEGLPPSFFENLRKALAHYGVESFDSSSELDASLLAIYKSHQRVNAQLPVITAILDRRLKCVDKLASTATKELHMLLDRLLFATQGRYPAVSDMTREVRFYYFDQPLFEQARNKVYDEVRAHLAYLVQFPNAADRDERIDALVACPQPLQTLLTSQFPESSDELRQIMLEALLRRYYRIRRIQGVRCMTIDGQTFATTTYEYKYTHIDVASTFAEYANLDSAIKAMSHFITQFPAEHDVAIDFYVWRSEAGSEGDALQQDIHTKIENAGFSRHIRRIVVAVIGTGKGLGMASAEHFTYRPSDQGYQEQRLYRGFHPMMGKRLHVWRLANFSIERLPSAEDVYLFRGVARDNPKDERLFAISEVRDVTPLCDQTGRVIQIPHLERMLMETLADIRLYQSRLPFHKRLPWNRVLLYVWPPLGLQPEEFLEIMRKFWPATEGLGLEKIVVQAKIVEPGTGKLLDRALHFSTPGGRELIVHVGIPSEAPVQTLTEYRQKVVQLHTRGLVYPYELIQMLTPPCEEGAHTILPPGNFTEYDLDENNHLVPAKRPYGQNRAGIVVGVIRNYTTKYPEGMTRVILLGDPSMSLGSVAEPECRRVIEALNLAEQLQVPVEWFTVSAGAKISMDSGTENMDWVSRTLQRLIRFTQNGGEVNVIVNAINVGAQPYWNSEATMLMHTRGILIMTPNGAMVLTGKQSLDYSGGVSAEDNSGIGGYERVMGPNGQAQYFAPDLDAACQILMRHYEHAYVIPGERFPRRAETTDPATRDIQDYPYVSARPEDCDLTRVGDLFSEKINPGRKRPFDMRTVMSAIIDADHPPLERWAGMRDADTAIVWDAHIGGYPVAMLGIESRPIPRHGFVPGDGPQQWTAGTLFPMASKKVARTINSTSGSRPLVVIANLSGFDGSPESLRNCQLEYGAEVGKAIINFKGPIVFCVISRYHGGSFVVFSKVLNENLEVAALEGSYASVIGGVPAAAVVFARDVDTRTKADPRVKAIQEQLAHAPNTLKAALQLRLSEVTAMVRSEKVGEIAHEFDHIHSVERAQRVGSIDHVIPPSALRPYLIEALERGIEREMRRITMHSTAY